MNVIRTFVFLIFLFWCTQEIDSAQCHLNGACQKSFELQITLTESEFQCWDFCQNDPACYWYTRYHDNGFCLTYANCTSIDESIHAVSGQKECPDPCLLQGHCQGTFINVLVEQSVSSCLESCVQDPQCQWFTFNSIDKSCLSLENCQTITECVTCTSGEKDCESSQGDKPILLNIGGNRGLPDELIDLRTGSSCQEIQSNFDQGFGDFVNGRPVFCERTTADTPCFELTSGTNEWNRFTNTQFPRSYPGHVILPNGDWLISGTMTYEGEATSEILGSDNHFHIGPHLPEQYMHHHCTVQWNETHTFFTGGFYHASKTYFYDWNEKEWAEGPRMNHDRISPACGVVKDPTDGKQKVIVAGGVSDEKRSAEFFNGQSWMDLPSLPVDAYHSTAVIFNNRFLLITDAGLNAPEILEYSFVEEAWIHFGNLVHGQRDYLSAFLVPETYCKLNQ